jgi:hypothetical protein
LHLVVAAKKKWSWRGYGAFRMPYLRMRIAPAVSMFEMPKPTKGERIHRLLRQQVMETGEYDPMAFWTHETNGHWRERVQVYVLPRRTPISIRRIHQRVGVGVFARKDMPSGKRLYELKGMDGPMVSQRLVHASRSRYTSIRQIRTPQGAMAFRTLLGPLAFLNHACSRCANVLPYDWFARETGARGWSDWSLAMTLRPIRAGEELLVHYGDEIDYPCRNCNC